MSDSLRTIFVITLCLSLSTSLSAGTEDDRTNGEQPPPATAEPKTKLDDPRPGDDLNGLERQFVEKMSPSVLVGRYSVSGTDKEQPRPERYEISNVQKLRGDYWVFNAKITYGETDVTVPITLRVLWAGDTPVITLTDLTIPALGTFTSRVMIYGNRYAGTWQHGKVGGHLWGHIEKLQADEQPAATNE